MDTFSLSTTEAIRAIGAIAKDPWTLVSEPFQPEFLPGRRWNRHAAQLRYAPTTGGQVLAHPHFDKVLNHLGKGLDSTVAKDAWCKAHGVLTGGAYLTLWVASLLRQPKQSLPYLFFFSEGNTGQEAGKSTFHKAIGLTLMKGGYVEAKHALTEHFNGQLANAVLCYIDDVKLEGNAYFKIKQWTDSDQISIRDMNQTAYMMPNYMHWVQTANYRSDCPIHEGDKRIVMVEVPALPSNQQIDWTPALKPKLEAEAPDFLASLIALTLPPSAGRLYLPVLCTEAKVQALGGSATQRKTPCKLEFSELEAVIKTLTDNVPSWEGLVSDFAKEAGRDAGCAATISRQLGDKKDRFMERGYDVDVHRTNTGSRVKLRRIESDMSTSL